MAAAARHRRIEWWFRGAALVALLAYLPGHQASRSGGLVEVEHWLNHPVLLLGAAAVLLVVSMVVQFEFRARWAQIGFAAVLSPLIVIGAAIGALAYAFGDDGRLIDRKPAPGNPRHVLTVTDIAFSIDPIYRVELLTGSGWSARHWDVGTWEEGDGFRRAEWSGPDRITVTVEHETRVYTVGGDGRLGQPEVTPR
ncbi:hypothetical protein [Streptomyces sp. NRRL S-350]|uniref:hypothetical protein n=1 Tax=Streptomyces sp. NRRL S-350 TaxID=1463902 RepID=UPI00131D5F83|nr:hypothetical protein [Streptomyces sp. NRRL S-350]